MVRPSNPRQLSGRLAAVAASAWLATAIATAQASAQPTILAVGQASSQTAELEQAGQLNDQAVKLNGAGRFAEAGPLAERALQIRERVLGRDHPDTLTSVDTLAAVYLEQGRYSEAEPLYQRGLQSRERVLGRDHRDTVGSVNELGVLYYREGRYAEAEPLYVRAVGTFERVLGRDHPDTLTSVDNLALLYSDQGRYAEAEPLSRRALGSRERVLGRDHPDTLTSVNNLAVLLRYQGRYSEAEPLYQRALDSSERVLGRDHPHTLTSVNELAALYRDQGRFPEAQPFYQRALEASERVLGRDHPDTLSYAERMLIARLEQPEQATQALAVVPARILIDGVRQRRQRVGSGQGARMQRERESTGATVRFGLFADAAWAAATQDTPQRAALEAEAFAAVQEAVSGSAEQAIAEQAAGRYASERQSGLTALLRDRRRLEDDWTRLDGELASSFGDSNNGARERIASIRAQLGQVQARIDAVDARLLAEAPDYFNLIQPTPLSIEAARTLLAPDEVVLVIVPSRFGTHVVAVTRAGTNWQRSEWNAGRVREAVQRLRRDLGARVDGTPEELARLRADRLLEGRPSFDRATAHAIYQQLIAPVAPSLTGKRRVYIAAGGALAALPFSVLVTAPPPGGKDNDPAALRATGWFGDDFALIHIPSLQSLALLRQEKLVQGGANFFGIGDPALQGPVSRRHRGAAGGIPDARSLFRTDRTRDGGLIADGSMLRELARLPGTAIELEAVRRALGAGPSSLLTAERATEPNVRSVDLSRVGVLLFSTHGLTADEAVGVGESGLVLTPPPPGKEQDGNDGYLAASEVTTLRLTADWVILSACNTAAGDGTENPGLGQLARAFFFAGARNLLASHWPVSDEVAPLLVTRTLELERTGTPRAEALQTAAREVRMNASADTSEDSWAHPFYWAPFVLIGDGGT